MAGKKRKEQQVKLEAPFKNMPFASLKGVKVEDTPAPEPIKKVSAPVKKNEPDADELFRQAMDGVSRVFDARPHPKGAVREKKVNVSVSGTETADKKVLPRDEVIARKTFLKEVEKLKLDVRFEDSLPEGELRPIAGNRLKQLKRGIIKLDRQLDLHGLTREESLQALAPFLKSACKAGEKAVLVITGKGNHSVEGPVLQQVVAAWLRDQGRELITEFAPAPAELGGGGAFVVFLRPLDKQADE